MYSVELARTMVVALATCALACSQERPAPALQTDFTCEQLPITQCSAVRPSAAGRWHFTRTCMRTDGPSTLTDAACAALDGELELKFNDDAGRDDRGDFTLVLRNTSADCGAPLIRTGKFTFHDLPVLGAFVSVDLAFDAPSSGTTTIQLYVGCPAEVGRPVLYLQGLAPGDHLSVAVHVPD